MKYNFVALFFSKLKAQALELREYHCHSKHARHSQLDASIYVHRDSGACGKTTGATPRVLHRGEARGCAGASKVQPWLENTKWSRRAYKRESPST